MLTWGDSVESTAVEFDALIVDIEANGLPAVWVEMQLDPATANTIAAQAGTRVHSGENPLFTDALGPAGANGETCMALTVLNITQLLDAWGGGASELPAEI